MAFLKNKSKLLGDSLETLFTNKSSQSFCHTIGIFLSTFLDFQIHEDGFCCEFYQFDQNKRKGILSERDK